MSLLSTIAYDGTHETKEIPFKGIGLAVAALVLGAAIGYVIADNPPAADAPVATATGMALDDFIRLNTTAYEGLVPMTATVATPQTVTDQFLNVNISSYEGLVPTTAAEPQTVGQPFLDMNVSSYEGLAPSIVSPAVATQQVGDAFIDMNVTSYEGLVPSVVTETRRAVDPSFLYWNVEAYNGLSPAEASEVLRSLTTADRNLWVMNVTSYGHQADEYADQPSGPR